MHILFIHSINDILSPTKPLRSPSEMQFGISYISSLLKKHGHNTRLLVLSRMFGKRGNLRLINEYIKDFSPKLICFSTVSTEYPFIRDMAGYIKKKYPGIFSIIGGPHVSLNPQDVIQDEFDCLCIGEGEYPVRELVEQLEEDRLPRGIENLWRKNGSEIEKNATRPFMQDIDSLPFPDREMWYDWIEEEPGSEYPVLLGRGCPFHCTYCCNHALKNLAKGVYVRFRSTENIINEIKEINAQNPTKTNIYLEVETIGANKNWLQELCLKLERLNATLKHPLSYRTNLRVTPNLDLNTIFSAFKRCNLTTINIGVESGSERIRREVLKRDYSNQDIINAVKLAKGFGFKVHFYNLMGIPGETLDNFKETIKLNRICQPDKVYTHIFFPYPGTELHSVCREKGLLPKTIDTDLERCKAVLDLPGFSRREIERNFIWFDYNVYKGYKPLSNILAKVLVSKFRSNTHLHKLYRTITYSPLLRKLKSLVKPS